MTVTGEEYVDRAAEPESSTKSSAKVEAKATFFLISISSLRTKRFYRLIILIFVKIKRWQRACRRPIKQKVNRLQMN